MSALARSVQASVHAARATAALAGAVKASHDGAARRRKFTLVIAYSTPVPVERTPATLATLITEAALERRSMGRNCWHKKKAESWFVRTVKS